MAGKRAFRRGGWLLAVAPGGKKNSDRDPELGEENRGNKEGTKTTGCERGERRKKSQSAECEGGRQPAGTFKTNEPAEARSRTRVRSVIEGSNSGGGCRPPIRKSRP